MDDSEVFNQKRMDRCAVIQQSIMTNWQRTNSFTYTCRATDSVHGLSLGELRTRYFAVGVEDEVTEIPFHDMLVVFSMIDQECKALKNRVDKTATDFQIHYEITTHFPDPEAARLLSEIRIETPFDPGKVLRMQALRKPRDE